MRLEQTDCFKEIDLYDGEIKVGSMEIETDKKELSRLVIYEPYRNKGYGQRAVELAKDLYGVESLWVRSDNSIAIHIYEKAGFKIGEERMYEMKLKQ